MPGYGFEPATVIMPARHGLADPRRSPSANPHRMVNMAHHHPVQTPVSCDLLELVADPQSDAQRCGLGFLVWMTDSRGEVVVRAAATLADVARTARAYCAAWNATVRCIEDPHGLVLDRTDWAPLVEVDAPLPYIYRVELRSPQSVGHGELITVLWTSTDLQQAWRWRALLPLPLRERSLVVSNAPDGHYPRRTPTNNTGAVVTPSARRDEPDGLR